MAQAAEVIVPLPVKSNFDYRVPPEWEGLLQPGMRVLVAFGKNKIYTGVVKKVREENHPERLAALKMIDTVLDEMPVLQSWQLEIINWTSFYYDCTEGEVMKAALPASLKLESEVWVEDAGVEGWEEFGLGGKEEDLMEMLRVRPAVPLTDVAKLWKVQAPAARLRAMQGRGLIRLVYRVSDTYTAKTEPFIEIAPEFRTEEKLNAVFESLKRAPRQEEVMMLVAAEFLRGKAMPRKEITRQLKGASEPIRALAEKGILRETELEVDRLGEMSYKKKEAITALTADQQQALAVIRESFIASPSKPVLIEGVTGSGKTQLYVELIREQIAQGRQALYLLPEIALTQQIVDRIRSEFGERAGIYHSRFSDNERVDIWKKVLGNQYDVVIGVRSAIFLPFTNPGLFIMDEEHDHSFKQEEPNPRYHARDLAAYIARELGSHIVMGTATPSLETYQNALAGKYTHVTMKTRATEAALPEIRLVDMREERKRKTADGDFSSVLVQELRGALARREQVILFQNRRGYAPFLLCTTCGHVPRCINCDISLTFHKGRGHLRCHYCGYTDFETDKCTVCSNYTYIQRGTGTEKIEEEIKRIVPEARIQRMDLDTTRTRTAFQKVIRSFENHETDILVGTQMVSKGFDFGNVTLVGVIEADPMLAFADFRAHERAYQLLTQVSGRAGRAAKRGQVIIQTYNPEEPLLKLLQKDFKLFYDHEIAHRRQRYYPPFVRLIRIEIRHKDKAFIEKQAMILREMFRKVFGEAFQGPEYPPVNRLRGVYRMQALLKLDKTFPVARVREYLATVKDQYFRQAPEKTLRIIVDVDPY